MTTLTHPFSSLNWVQKQSFLYQSNPRIPAPSLGCGGSCAGSRHHHPWSGHTSSRKFENVASDPLVVDFADGSFIESEIKKITWEKRLTEIVLTTHKSVRRYIQYHPFNYPLFFISSASHFTF